MRYIPKMSAQTLNYTLMAIIDNIMKDMRKIKMSHLDRYCNDLIETLSNTNLVTLTPSLIPNDMTPSFHLNTQCYYQKEIEHLKSRLQDEIKLILTDKSKCKPTMNQKSQEKLTLLLKEIKALELENKKKRMMRSAVEGLMGHQSIQRLRKKNQEADLTPEISLTANPTQTAKLKPMSFL